MTDNAKSTDTRDNTPKKPNGDNQTAQINNPTPNPQPLNQPEQQPDPNNPINGNGHRDPGAGGDALSGLSAVEQERALVQNETGNDPGPNVTPRPEIAQRAKENKQSQQNQSSTNSQNSR